MIVAEMTAEEMVDELLADAKSANAWSMHQKRTVGEKTRALRVLPGTFQLEHTTPRRNHFIMTYRPTKRNIIKTPPGIILSCVCNWTRGKYVFTVATVDFGQWLGEAESRPGTMAVAYLPHFFSRYNERAGIGQTGDALIRTWLRRNMSLAVRFYDNPNPEYKDKTCFYVSSEDGVGVGYMLSPRLALVKTFITYDMAKGQQIEQFATARMERAQFPLTSRIPIEDMLNM